MTEPDESRDHNQASTKPTTGDEEWELRESIEQSGEPKRDKLGNADGAS